MFFVHEWIAAFVHSIPHKNGTIHDFFKEFVFWVELDFVFLTKKKTRQEKLTKKYSDRKEIFQKNELFELEFLWWSLFEFLFLVGRFFVASRFYKKNTLNHS